MGALQTPENAAFRYGSYVEELQEFLATSGLHHSAPEDVLAVSERLETSETFSADLSSMVRSIVLREGGTMPHAELLEILALAVGGPEMSRAPQHYRQPLRHLLAFLTGVLRRPWSVPPGEEIPTEEAAAPEEQPPRVEDEVPVAEDLQPFESMAPSAEIEPAEVESPETARAEVESAETPQVDEPKEPEFNPDLPREGVYRRAALLSFPVDNASAARRSLAANPSARPPGPTLETRLEPLPAEAELGSIIAPIPARNLPSDSTSVPGSMPTPAADPVAAKSGRVVSPSLRHLILAGACSVTAAVLIAIFLRTEHPAQRPVPPTQTQTHARAVSATNPAPASVSARNSPASQPLAPVAPAAGASAPGDGSSQASGVAAKRGQSSRHASQEELIAEPWSDMPPPSAPSAAVNTASGKVTAVPSQAQVNQPGGAGNSPEYASSAPITRTPLAGQPSANPGRNYSEGRAAGDRESGGALSDHSRYLSVSSGVMAGNLVSAPMPAYPGIAKIAHIHGKVILQAVISRDGSVSTTHVLSGHRLLRGAAVDAVRRWHYRPYMLNGHPVDVATIVTVDFRNNQ